MHHRHRNYKWILYGESEQATRHLAALCCHLAEVTCAQYSACHCQFTRHACMPARTASPVPLAAACLMMPRCRVQFAVQKLIAWTSSRRRRRHDVRHVSGRGGAPCLARCLTSCLATFVPRARRATSCVHPPADTPAPRLIMLPRLPGPPSTSCCSPSTTRCPTSSRTPPGTPWTWTAAAPGAPPSPRGPPRVACPATLT
jgi:hypothetical protein